VIYQTATAAGRPQDIRLIAPEQPSYTSIGWPYPYPDHGAYEYLMWHTRTTYAIRFITWLLHQSVI